MAGIVLVVSALDAKGNALNNPASSAMPELHVMRPAEQTGVGGHTYVGPAVRVVDLRIELTHAINLPAGSFDLMATTVVDSLRFEGPDRWGETAVTGIVRTDPPGLALCHPMLNLIFRDHAGRIIVGDQDFVEGKSISSSGYRLPKATDLARTEAYVGQGRSPLSPDEAGYASCRKGGVSAARRGSTS